MTTSLSSSSNDTARINMSPSRLLSLPPELRNKIYSFTLVRDKPIEISERSALPSKAAQGATLHHARLIEPAFLLTCRQIRHEALSILYVYPTPCSDLSLTLLHQLRRKHFLHRHQRRPSSLAARHWSRESKTTSECMGVPAESVFQLCLREESCGCCRG